MLRNLPGLLVWMVGLSLFALPGIDSAGFHCAAWADEVTPEAVEKILETCREKNEVPALAAAIVRVGQPTVIAAVGVRKRGDETKVEPDDKFHLGSCTKAMTATLIAKLVEQGKLKWDTPLETVFADLGVEISPQLRPVTLAHLLAHQSTLEDLSLSEFRKLSTGDIKDQRLAVVKQALTQKSDKKPGESFKYANINYIVAGAIAEQATGKSWEELMEEEIFKPLQMTSAGQGPMATPGKVDQPWSHFGNGKPVEPGPFGDNPTVLGPAGRAHCSVGDWAKFATEHLVGEKGDGALLKPESYKLLHTPEFAVSYTRGGWGASDTPWGKGLMHDGSNTLNYSTALLLPEKGVAILVACNQGDTEKHGAVACTEARKALANLVLGKKD